MSKKQKQTSRRGSASRPKTRQKARPGRTAISKPATLAMTPVTAPLVLTPELKPAQLAFCLAYLENGFNATRAYQDSHPEASYATAMSEGWRTLRIPKIASYLKKQSEGTWKDLQLGAEEALARVGFAATFDIASIFDDQDKLLPVSKWPLEVRQLVESVDLTNGKVKFTSRSQALRIVLEQSGKLRSLAGGIDELAAAIRADKEAHAGAMQP